MIKLKLNLLFFLILNPSLLSTSSSSSSVPIPPPLPILPIPSSRQLQWQQSEMALFFHFGTNTFTDSEWGTGRADPSIFNPTQFDPEQWIRVAKSTGFSRVVLTAKHHDGFCLWPSELTEYSVKSSAWRNRNGDILGELAKTARESGIDLGVYLSPWDRHEATYGKTLEYNEFYIGQMTELLTRYGDIKEVFLDGAKGEGEKDMEYFFDTWFNLIHQLQPGAAIFSDAGPDVRWVGDEDGVAAPSCWSLFNQSDAKVGAFSPYSKGGDPRGRDWVPAECDVSIRPGWFWHASEHPKSAETLLDIYYKSMGRNCRLLLNVPPNTLGLISDEDIQALQEFAKVRDSIFSNNLAKNAVMSASSTRGGINNSRFGPNNVLTGGIYTYWAPEENQCKWQIFLDFQERVSFNVLKVQEPIQMGQRVSKFHLDILNRDGEWEEVVNGTTVGYQRLLLFQKVKSRRLRLVIDESRADPLISYLGIYIDNVSNLRNMVNTSSISHFNGSQILRQSIHNNSNTAAL